MPRPPATRDQVDAYRYGLRRMEAALVRGDTVPLHEGLRSQRRAAFAGVLLALLALGAVALHAVLFPAKDWRKQTLVMGAASGAVYAVARDPDRLVPVADTASGRLVLAALGVQGGAGAVPVPVDDDDLATAPRTAAAAVPGARGVLPEAAGPAARWAVCDRVAVGGRTRLLGTTVVAGSTPAPAGPAPAVLVQSEGAYFAIIDGVRHRVPDPGDPVLRAALDLDPAAFRQTSPGLISAIPEGAVLKRPSVAPGVAPGGVDARVGDVLDAGGRQYVVLTGGLQEVGPLAAAMLSAMAHKPPSAIAPARVAAVPQVRGVLDVDGWPVPPAKWVIATAAPVLCWQWAPEATVVTVGTALPVPAGAATVDLAQADGPGALADAVAFGSGAGGPVRATAPGQPAGAGPLWLLSTTGVAYGVVGDETAGALGVGPAQAAPDGAVRLLPAGPPLDLAAVDKIVDVPVG